MQRKEERFLALFLKHQPGLSAFIRSMVRDRHAAEDVFQEVALVLWRRFEEYDPGRPFGAWARGIAANKILQSRERDRRRPRGFSAEALQAVLEAYNRAEDHIDREREALRECLEELPEKARHLLSLRYEHSLRLAEVARRLGNTTAEAVRKALSRLRLRLRDCIRRRLPAGGAEGLR